MKNIIAAFKNVFNRILAFLPTKLPIGIEEFNAWAKSVVELLPKGFEGVPEDQKHWVLAAAIQHLPSTAAYVPKRYFVKLMVKAAASQVAGQVFMDVKTRQEQQKQAEATAKVDGSGQKEVQ